MSKTLKNVLIIANQFPPMGGSGVQRTSKFVKYLPLFGYNPIVLTRDCVNLPIVDESLLADVSNAEIIRTRSYDLSNLKGVMRIPGKVVSKYVLMPDSDRIWAEKSFNMALETIDKFGISLVYSTSYPYSDHLLALKLKKSRPDLKWVCDFRDEWTNNPYTLDNPHNAVRAAIEKRMESETLHTADALISNTPVMVENFIKLNNLSGEGFHTIPNGYDEDDFVGIVGEKPKNGKFTVTYTGALYGRRKPDTFYEALKELLDEGAMPRESVSVSLIGRYNENRVRADVERFGLTGVVSILPYMPHGECIKRLSESDCLLLIEGEGRGAEAFYTGKIFEYMMAKTPVLAIIPENGAAAGLVKSTNIGIVCGFNNINEIKRGFMLYYDMWSRGEACYAPIYEEISKYERKELTKKLASVFDGLLE